MDISTIGISVISLVVAICSLVYTVYSNNSKFVVSSSGPMSRRLSKSIGLGG